jgi:hypothetical protein
LTYICGTVVPVAWKDRKLRRKAPGIQARSLLARALEHAAEDPEAFRAEAQSVARQLGVTLEEVYRLVQHKQKLGDLALSWAARRLRRELGL